MIHSDVSGPLPIPTFDGHRYFITSIDEFRIGYIYLVQEKSGVLDLFKNFKIEVGDNQIGK